MATTKFAFFQGKIVPIAEAKISIMTHAFNYGTAVFEGIRAYWNADQRQLYVFRLPEHYERLLRSCRILLIDLPYTVADLCRITVDLLRQEGFQEDTYIRPIAYKSSTGIGVRLHDLAADFCIFSTPFGKYIEREESRAAVSSWHRPGDNVAPPRAKITGIYINSALAKTEAVLNGFEEAIVLTQQGYVSEGSAENLFLVRNGVLITPSLSQDLLEGITRATIITLAGEMGIPVEERQVGRSELYVADEVFFCGTGVQIAPVTEVDRRPVGSGKVGPITRRISNAYFDIVKGKVPAHLHWCTPVYEH